MSITMATCRPIYIYIYIYIYLFIYTIYCKLDLFTNTHSAHRPTMHIHAPTHTHKSITRTQESLHNILYNPSYTQKINFNYETRQAMYV